MKRLLVLLSASGCALLFVGGASPHSLRPAAARTLIVYWSESPWPSIWSIRPNGSKPRRLLHNRQNAKRPRLSPDRRWVAFDGAPPGKHPLSDFDIQLVRVDGTGRRTVTNTPEWDTDAQWSPDGRRIAFSRLPPHPIDERDSTVWIVDRNGGNGQRVAGGATPRWSPDGAKLVYERPSDASRGELVISQPDGSGPQSLLRADQPQAPVGWSRDGDWILFNRFLDDSTVAIFVIHPDGTGLRRLGSGIAAAWSPDGARILYTTSFASALWTMKRDGTGKRRIASVTASEPDWR